MPFLLASPCVLRALDLQLGEKKPMVACHTGGCIRSGPSWGNLYNCQVAQSGLPAYQKPGSCCLGYVPATQKCWAGLSQIKYAGPQARHPDPAGL
ncbi:hypothetical protein F5Y17DRAFT_135341 [Xylariaceae sp. FL0594]|nr:hypothetical protein F5Y17DRAFT_135341 [Xylariaceae sp. FL0594]